MIGDNKWIYGQLVKEKLEAAVSAHIAQLANSGVKQERIAERLGIAQMEVSHLPRGKATMSIDKLLWIAKRCGIAWEFKVGEECESQ